MKQLYRLNGTPPFNYNTPLSIVLTLLLLLFTAATGYTQVNAYAKVTAYSAANRRLTISNRNQNHYAFAAGRQVIIMQMQDNVIGTNTNNDANFGRLGTIANAGIFEIGTISAVTGTTITLTNALENTFNFATGNVQVISFTTLGNPDFTTSVNIPAVPWDPDLGIGGVVAFQVNGVLTLRHSVTADGQGFRGGERSTNYENSCQPTVYRTNSTRQGAKGEGIYLNTEDDYSRGRARLLNGGGGGNDDNAGGAGGGNYSAGGDGGAGWTCAGNTAAGGLGGITLNTYLMAGNRLFMGGGGGGGQGNNGTQTNGSNGGGIIIIKANSITTNCTTPIRISANGNNAGNTTGDGNDGAGGAGAGGTILLVIGNYNIPASCPLTIRANGGNGGSVINTGAHGGGGGGGQGAILFSGATPTNNVNAGTAPGQGGLNNTGGTRANSGSGSNNAGIIGGIGNPLPVRLISFSAENNNKKAVLYWTTADESNTTFQIQHAIDGVNFTTIGTVNGTGTINTTTNYTYTDARVINGKNYYRLAIVDNATGKTEYSTIVSVNISDAENISVAWPNPAHDHFNIRVNSIGTNKNFVVTVSDITGHIIYSNTYRPANSIITVTHGKPLQPGLYMYKISSDGIEQTGKLIIQ
jgi:hypothetical protein